jgi:hypothetical protein
MVICSECGASNRADAQFCAQCDAYLAWSGDAGDGDATTGDPQGRVRQPASQPGVARPSSSPPERPRVSADGGGGDAAVRGREPTAPTAGDGEQELGAVRPAEPKAKVRKHYGTAQPRREAGRWASSAANQALHHVPGGRHLPGQVPQLGGSTMEGARAARGFSREMRAAAGGRRLPYDRKLTTRVMVVRTVLGVLALLALVVLIGPWRGPVRSFADRQLDRVIPGRFEELPVESVALWPATDEQIVGFLPSYAVDGIPTRAWATRWNPEAAAAPGEPCAAMTDQQSDQQSLDVRFAGPSRVDRVTLLPGLPADSADRLKQARPRVVDMLFSNQQCVRQEVPDSAAPLDINLEVPEVASVTVQVVDAYPAQSGAGNLVAFSEITFARR